MTTAFIRQADIRVRVALSAHRISNRDTTPPRPSLTRRRGGSTLPAGGKWFQPKYRDMPETDDDGTQGDGSAQGRWRFWIDRGGTFTDIVAKGPDGAVLTGGGKELARIGR